MQPNILFLSSAIGVLGLMTCIQALPIEVIYAAGDTCECPKKIDYAMDMPIPAIPKVNTPSAYGYKIESPLKAKASVTYSFDFDVEQPAPKPPIPESKLDIYAKVDRVTALKKDCHATQKLPRTCGCYRCSLGNRYVLPERGAARITRNLRHPNSIDNTESSSKLSPAPKIMAIFFKPSRQPIWDVSKTRNKRDISRIFMRPKKSQKRSDRVVKQYKKPLKDVAASKKKLPKETRRPNRSRDLGVATSNGLLPLEQLSSILRVPRLRNKRDIKGEYDLIEKDREQMDLTLPEIIQYMPETLDPNFKRNQCNCRHTQFAETATTPAMATAPSETATTSFTTEVTTPATLNGTGANNLKNEVKEEKQTDNDCSATHKKRKARNNIVSGCPIVIDAYNPTPTARYTYESLANFESMPRPFSTANYKYGSDPIPQQFVGAPYNPYASAIVNSEPMLGAAFANPTIPSYANAQLDHIISAVIHRHSDFLEGSTKRDKALVDPTQEQKEQTIYFLKSLLTDWGDWRSFGENHQQQQQHPHHQQHPISHSLLRRPLSN